MPDVVFGSFDYDYTHIFFIMVISIHPILFLYHNIWVKLLKWKTWIWWPKKKMVVLALVSHELMSVNVCHVHKSQVFVQRRKPLIHVLSLVYWRFGNKKEYHHWFINNAMQFWEILNIEKHVVIGTQNRIFVWHFLKETSFTWVDIQKIDTSNCHVRTFKWKYHVHEMLIDCTKYFVNVKCWQLVCISF